VVDEAVHLENAVGKHLAFLQYLRLEFFHASLHVFNLNKPWRTCPGRIVYANLFKHFTSIKLNFPDVLAGRSNSYYGFF
jgi:hypothetical protein